MMFPFIQWVVTKKDHKGKITALLKIEEHEVFVEEFLVIFVVICAVFSHFFLT